MNHNGDEPTSERVNQNSSMSPVPMNPLQHNIPDNDFRIIKLLNLLNKFGTTCSMFICNNKTVAPSPGFCTKQITKFLTRSTAPEVSHSQPETVAKPAVPSQRLNAVARHALEPVKVRQPNKEPEQPETNSHKCTHIKTFEMYIFNFKTVLQNGKTVANVENVFL